MSKFELLKQIPYLRVWEAVTFSNDGSFVVWGSTTELILALEMLFKADMIDITDNRITVSKNGYLLVLEISENVGTWTIEEEI